MLSLVSTANLSSIYTPFKGVRIRRAQLDGRAQRANERIADAVIHQRPESAPAPPPTKFMACFNAIFPW